MNSIYRSLKIWKSKATEAAAFEGLRCSLECTIEAQGFRDHLEDFARAGWQVVGVSNDDVAAHCGFRDHHGLNFPLLCDVDRTLSNDCGLMSEQVKDGKTRIRINRSTLLIDENGRLLKVMKGVVAREHVAELLQMLCSK